MRFLATLLAAVLLAAVCRAEKPGPNEPSDLNIPAQTGDRALLEFSRQAQVDVLFPFNELKGIQTNAVVGRYPPQQALELLLQGKPFTARPNGNGKWVVTPNAPPRGQIKGKVLAPDGSPARRVRVTLTGTTDAVPTSDTGDFAFSDVAPGRYVIVVTEANYRPLQIVDVVVVANAVTQIDPHVLVPADDPTRLDPFVVEAHSPRQGSLDHSDAPFSPRRAAGNLDLARTESDALPYMIFNHTQIARSGVVNLNEFLQRELIDSSAVTLPPEQNGSADPFKVGSSNLSLRGFSDEETVILINGRPLPEVLISGVSSFQPPDVNFIPLSLVQQVEVLPVSASSLYSGNAVGGVINIVLRPDSDATVTEVTATYTNALAHYDAPQSSLSLLHSQSLLHGKLRFRLNANFTRSTPPTEAELGYHQRRPAPLPEEDTPVFRATPNVRSVHPQILPLAPDFSADNAATEPAAAPKTTPLPPPLPPLAALGPSAVTSVAPGSDGTSGLAAFRGRSGVRNFELFDSRGGFAASLDSIDYPYGREQQRSTYYGSAVYDATSWLQLALDGTYSKQVIHRGYDVIPADLSLKATSPFNPFHQDVMVSLNETAPALGQHYSEARLEVESVVLGALIKAPREWQFSLDAQYAHNTAQYRGLSGANLDRWQALVDRGGYNPLRDTQVFGPPQSFYDQVLIYRGRPGQFVTLGDYDSLDVAGRATNEALPFPTGNGVVNIGGDYRRDQLADYTDARRYADGTPADDILHYGGRTLARYSAFAEMQAPIVPEKWLPKAIKSAETDLALRYVAANSTREANFAPTYGLKLTFPGGVSVRGSITTSNRFPTPQMSHLLVAPATGEGTSGVDRTLIHDPLRNQTYSVVVNEVLNPDLRPEGAVTQTAGMVIQRGRTHRFRAAIDFVDTHKENELTFLDANTVVARESLWPERVQRAPAGPNDNRGAGLITSVITSRANLASRHSQDWTASIDYRWNECFGGTFEAYSRTLYFQSYTVRALPNTPKVDELNAPDGLMPLLKYRANFGASWSNAAFALGTDGHYYHSRLLPQTEWESQGHDRIRPFWQFDAFVQTELSRWLPWQSSKYRLRLQARVNNVLGTEFPKYVNDPSGAGVQPYGDWRGRVYSLSLTATF